MGHVTAAYSDPLFLGHVWGGMQYVLKRNSTAVALPASKTQRIKTGDGSLTLFQPTGRKVSGAEKAIGARFHRP